MGNILSTPPPTIGDLVVGALARCGYNILSSPSLSLKLKLNLFLNSTVQEAVVMVNKNLPAQSVVEKLMGGPLDKLISNLEVPIANAVVQFACGKYDELSVALDNRAKATNQ